jgi:hypothetical protein
MSTSIGLILRGFTIRWREKSAAASPRVKPSPASAYLQLITWRP